ncbi:ankyrin repeat domain-containing protein [Legionella sp. CNM-4043-24]|uniref:ankyrin repeat domain-containing protein n=1 Tax=Legionella sp. CNM-4043-24 TaxID=3421646 RepID=UPI00403A8985
MINDIELGRYLSEGAIDMAVVASRISQGANPNTLNNNLDSLLHITARSGDIHHIRAALDTGIDVHISNGEGHTALYWLLNQTPCHFEAALMLIKAGASPNTVNHNGDNLLHLAVRSAMLDVIRAALALKINPHSKNRQGQTPLLELLSRGTVNPDAIALLVLVDSLHLTLDEASLRIQRPGLYLNRKDLERLGKHSNNKERVIQFIEQLPPEPQRRIIDLCQNEQSALGAFFYAQRGLIFKPTLASGTLAHLTEIRRRLPSYFRAPGIATIHAWNSAVYSTAFFPASHAVVASAPTYLAQESDYAPAYPPSMMSPEPLAPPEKMPGF